MILFLLLQQLSNEIRADFLKKVHHVMRNAGNIVIFISKGDLAERDNWTTTT